MSLSEQLQEAVGSAEGRRRAAHRAGSKSPDILSRKEKGVINKALDKAGFGGRERFRSVGEALNIIAGVLSKAGIEWGQVNSAHLFSADNGHQSIRLASQTSDPFSPVDITNTALGFQWTKLDGPRYEVIAYLG
jgi:hypothetical protein